MILLALDSLQGIQAILKLLHLFFGRIAKDHGFKGVFSSFFPGFGGIGLDSRLHPACQYCLQTLNAKLTFAILRGDVRHCRLHARDSTTHTIGAAAWEFPKEWPSVIDSNTPRYHAIARPREQLLFLTGMAGTCVMKRSLTSQLKRQEGTKSESMHLHQRDLKPECSRCAASPLSPRWRDRRSMGSPLR
jgi:hypothetical protein